MIKLKDLLNEAAGRYYAEYDKHSKKYKVYGNKGSDRFEATAGGFASEDNAKKHADGLNKLLSGYKKVADRKKENALSTFHKVFAYASNKNDWALQKDMEKIINYVTKNNVDSITLGQLEDWATGKDTKNPLDKILKAK